MRGYEATSLEEWVAADRTPTYKAAKRDSDGLFAIGDVVLQFICVIAFDLPSESYFQFGTVECRMTGADAIAMMTVNAVIRALQKKHLRSQGSRKPKSASVIARDLVIDMLANKKDWKPYASIFTGCAERNDRDFFERVARGIQRQRMQVFRPEEWYCLLNRHGWTDSTLGSQPPLKYWTPAAVVNLLHEGAASKNMGLKIQESGFRTMRTRLGLEQATPARVIGCFPVRGRPGVLKIETED